MKILVIDDNEIDIFTMQELLTNTNEVSVAYNGLDGQRSVKKEAPDLIITDLMMPIMTGLEFLEWIKSEEEYRNIPVIILTISLSEDEIKKAYSAGANSFFNKPSNAGEYKELLLLIEQYWGVSIKSLLIP